jgi:hypothetical protein
VLMQIVSSGVVGLKTEHGHGHGHGVTGGACACRSVRSLPRPGASTFSTSLRQTFTLHRPDAYHQQNRCPRTSASRPPSPMHPVVSLALENGAKHPHLVAPVLFIVLASIANAHQPVQLSLRITAVSWAVIWLLTAFKAGLWSHTSTKRRRAGWLAGAFLALAHLCDSAAGDKQGTWTAKVFT